MSTAVSSGEEQRKKLKKKHRRGSNLIQIEESVESGNEEETEKVPVVQSVKPKTKK